MSDMDILAARKKAAEKARTRKDPEPEPREEPKAADDATAAAPAEAALAESPAQEGAAPAAGDVAETDRIEAPAGDEPAAGPAPEMELLSFRVGGEEYAIKVDDVREVIKFRQLTVVPNAPGHILGVTSLRGTILPVVDLCKRLGLAPGVRDEKARIVVARTGDEDVGLLVDRVTGVQRIMPEAVRPAPENIEQGGEFLRGIARKDDRLYILLDLEKAVGG
jgi:purine-binding chemotaxis protein CheW